ncbi:hypothetical protein BH11BAC2_BH11BAC2_13440 [soil metagenome]
MMITKMKLKIKYTFLLGMSVICGSLSAQDFHVSQYNSVPVYKNAGLTGMFSDAKFRVNTLMRSQWASFTGKPFSTMFISYDQSLNNRFGAGAYLLSNSAPQGFKEQHMVMSGAYRITEPSSDHWLSVGLQAGMIFKSLKEDYTFDNQYTNGSFNGNLPDYENIERQSKLLPELNFGINYTMADPNKYVNPFINGSVFHITTPNESFSGTKSPLPRRILLDGGVIFNINEYCQVVPAVSMMTQGASYEYKGALSVRQTLQDENRSALLFQLQYRVKDAVVAALGWEYREFTYRIAYDFNTSALKKYSNNRGAVELGIQFKREAERKHRGDSNYIF